MIVDASSAIAGLEDLEQKVAKKYVRKALRAGCKVTLAAAQSGAPVKSGTLKRNIKLKSMGMRRGVLMMRVAISKKWFTGPAFYGAFVAFGHRIGKRTLGDSRAVIAPNDWLEKAYDTTKVEAVQVFGETIGALINDRD